MSTEVLTGVAGYASKARGEMNPRVVTIELRGTDPKVGITYSCGADEHSPVTVGAVDADGAAHGKVKVGDVVLAINGHSMLGRPINSRHFIKPEAAEKKDAFTHETEGSPQYVRLSVAAYYIPPDVESNAAGGAGDGGRKKFKRQNSVYDGFGEDAEVDGST